MLWLIIKFILSCEFQTFHETFLSTLNLDGNKSISFDNKPGTKMKSWFLEVTTLGYIVCNILGYKGDGLISHSCTSTCSKRSYLGLRLSATVGTPLCCFESCFCQELVPA